MPDSKQKIAIIVQRYGAEVNGGAEVNCRLIAEALAIEYDVTVLTTCAKEYTTWKPEFSVGEYTENNVTIKRFANEPRGSKAKLRYIRHKITSRLWYNYLLPSKGLRTFAEKLFSSIKISENDHNEWLKLQGPYSKTLVDFLSNNSDYFETFIFFSMLYYPTAVGIQYVKKKSILIPTLHNEKASFYPMYPKVINAAQWLFYGTEIEKQLAERIYDVSHKQNDIVGVGITVPKFNETSIATVSIKTDYILCLGRIDANKGSYELIDYFLKFKKNSNFKNLQLVMVGNASKPLKQFPDVIYTGFVDDYTKHQLLINCKCLIVPSKYESLSMVLLEAFYYKKPVMVNKHCDVLKYHIAKSKAGYSYTSYHEFEERLQILMQDPILCNQLGNLGYDYVNTYYNWADIITKFKKAINSIALATKKHV